MIVKLKVEITPPAPKGADAAQTLLLTNFLQPQMFFNIFLIFSPRVYEMVAYVKKCTSVRLRFSSCILTLYFLYQLNGEICPVDLPSDNFQNFTLHGGILKKLTCPVTF